MPKSNIIQQGAEARIIREGGHVIKDRISKKYRHPELDKKIIKTRTRSEAKLLERAGKLINIPKVIGVTELGGVLNTIEMEYIEGKKLSDWLEQLDYKNICKLIGNQIAKLHDSNIIHGDLTTSNMILVENALQEAKTKQQLIQPDQNSLQINNTKSKFAEQEEATSSYPKLYFIDFGLGFVSPRIEDKAVDMHLIKQALEAKHFTIHKECEKIILDNYNSKDREKILKQLKKVEARGRYKKGG